MSGVVAAGHQQTAQAGVEMLQQGGNAVDAAVAATFASFITESALVNIGAGGIAQVYDPKTGQAIVYDFFSTMPGLSTNGRGAAPQLDFREIIVDFGAAQQHFYIGRGSVAVPAAVAGLGTMLANRGRLPLAKILQPTIRWAREGVVLSSEQAYITSLLEPILRDTPGIAAIYAPQGRLVQRGERLYFPALADTLEHLGAQGVSLFYTGETARQICQDQQNHGGLLTETDLASYQVLHHQPIEVSYRDFTVLLPPPASDGGALIAFALKLLTSQSVSTWTHNSFDHLRLLAEVMRLTNVARAEWAKSQLPLAEPTVPQSFKQIDALLAETNLRKYRRLLEQALAGQKIVPEPDVPKSPPNTTHISVADSDGMVVSLTTSAGENAGFVVGDTGVMLNNMLGELDLHPHGFHKLPPGQRLTTMMSPTIVLHQGRPILALGSGGSNRLRSAILQTISNVIDFNHPLAKAVGAPRVHFEAGALQLEGGILPETAAQLEKSGYTVNLWPERNMFFGGAHAVACLDGNNDHWLAVGDARRGGAVARI